MASEQTFYATQDASIKKNKSTNGNWSKNEVYGGSAPVIAFVEFDLSSFSKGDKIQSATFRPYVRTLKKNQSSSFSIYSTTEKDWNQSSVRWATRPPKNQLLDTITIAKSGSYVNFEVTSAIQAAIDNGESKVTLWIEDSEEEYEGFEFDSVNKNASYPNEPELVIISGVTEADTTAPAYQSAATSTDGTKIILTYNETLSSTTAAASDFTVTADGSAATIAGVATSGTSVALTLSSAVTNGQTVTVAYADPTSDNDSNAIQDAAGNDAATLNTTTVSNQVAEAGQGVLQILGSTVNDKDWDQHVGGKHLRADLSQLSDRDITKAIAYQWYSNEVAVNGATSGDFKLKDHNISNEAIHLVATYTTLSGQQRSATSPTVNQLDWRIFSGGEGDSVEGENPTPFMETYSFARSSATHGGGGWYDDGYRASDTHSIKSTPASDAGLLTQEGSNILKIAATSDSKRAELGNRNWNTRVQENQDIYVSEKIYLPKTEWDPVTKYSTIIFQHKQYPGADPNFELRLSNEGDYKLYAQSPYSHYGLTGDKHNDHHIATLSPDTWHDLKIHLTPSQSSSKGQITIYLDREEIFSEKGTNLNNKDNTNDSFLKLGMYTQILDNRHYFVDAVEMATFLPSTVNAWVSGTRTDTTEPTPEPTPAPNPEPGDSNLSGNLADFDADAIAALPLATVADITARQIDQLAPESFQGLEPEQLAELNNKALRSLDPEQVEHLAPDAITGLGADQIQSLKPKVFQALSAEQISGVSGDTIGSIKKTQIRQLKPATIAGLDATHIEALKPTTLQILTTQQLNKLDPDAISGLNAQHIDRLKSTKFKAFTSEQIAELSDAAVGSINRNQIKKLQPDAIAGLDDQHIDALDPGLFQAFSIQQIKRLKPTAIASLDAQQAAQIKPNIFKGLSAKQLAALSTDVIDNLTAGQIQKVPSKAVKGFSDDQLQVLDATQVAALPKRLIKALEPEQLVALNNDAITGLSRTQLQHLPSDGLTGFQRRQIKALSTTAIPGLKPQVLNNLNQRQAKAFTSDQVLALSKRQRKQATAFLDQLSGDQRTLLGLPDDNRSNRWAEPGAGHPLGADLSNISSLL